LSYAMNEPDQEKFSQLLSSLPPELVSNTAINEFGSVLQDAVFKHIHFSLPTDFVRLLVEHGVDPTVGCETKEEAPIEIVVNKGSDYNFKSTQLLTLFSEFIELPTETKIKLLELLIQSDEDHSDIFKKHLESLSVDELASARIRARLHSSVGYEDASFVQYLASQSGKSDKLQLLLNHGLDSKATTEEVGYLPLEIAAINENTEAFDLLAPHYEENTKKKIAQLMMWGLKSDSVPSAEFKLLFESVPLAEVNSCTIVEFNLLSILVYNDKTPHVAFLLEQGVDPDTEASPEKDCPMRLACMHHYFETMVELAKYTEPDEDVKESSFWELVEKEQDRRWRKEGTSLLRKQQKQIEEQQKQIQEQQKQLENQSRLLKLVAKATGIEAED